MPPQTPDEEPKERDGKSRRAGLGGPPEGPEHKHLKLYVEGHPELLELDSTYVKRQSEYRFLSSDEVDVAFHHAKQPVLVEVKSRVSNDKDFERGVWQCVKYRALFEAQISAGAYKVAKDSSRTIRTMLLTERALPGDLSRLAKKVGIEHLHVRQMAGQH